MTGIGTVVRPSTQVLAEGFGTHVRRWAAAIGTLSDRDSLHRLEWVAQQLSLATSAGNVCVTLDELAAASEATPQALRRLLLESGVTGTPDAAESQPFILDAGNRLYLHRYFDYERRLAQRMWSAAAGEQPPTAVAAQRQLQLAFAANAALLNGRVDWQKIAAGLALCGKLTIISGGPGTGKTSTVANLLACLIAQDAHCRIALAAPTGKAAARMLDALRVRAADWPAELATRLPHEASTIHRLLGALPGGGFRHDRDHLLPIDVLVIDEASMLDLALAVRLFEAVPDAARIILLGDKDQLSAVESGAVFAELSADPQLTPSCVARLAALCDIPAADIVPPPVAISSGLRDCAVWFAESFRFSADSGVGRLASGIRSGDVAGVFDALKKGSESGLCWIEDATPTLTADAVRAVLDGYAPYLEAVRAGAGIDLITHVFGGFRALSALRDGSRGVAGLNQLIARHFRRVLDHPLDPGEPAPWYPGRPVIVSRNDYGLKLFNGDIGIALPDISGETAELRVYFVDRDHGFRAIAPRRLPAHETAFALTVHKAQGSEFDQVLLVLPDRPGLGVTRELLYTGVTRSRAQVTLVGTPEVLEAAILTRTQRHSGLAARLAEIRP
jgi:exodeoxyribonuclease V alpha subunit